MEALGIAIAALGFALSSVASFALSVLPRKDEKAPRTGEFFWLSFWLTGMLLLFRDLFRGIVLGMRDRKSDAFPLVIVWGVGLVLFIAGSWIWFHF